MDKQSSLSITDESIIVEDQLWGGPRALSLARRHKRFIQQEISPATNLDILNIEANLLIDEWELAFNGYPRDSAPLLQVREVISRKVEEARAVASSAVINITHKNKGGRAFTNNAFWIEIVRIALIDDNLGNRDALRQRMDNWIAENFSEGGPAESTKRQMLKELYETPGIRP